MKTKKSRQNLLRPITRQLFVACLMCSAALLTGCGGGSSSPSPTTTATPTSPPTPSPIPRTEVIISGAITYDYVDHASNGSLDYNDIREVPVRGASIVLLSSSGSTLAAAKTDQLGNYSLTSPAQTMVKIRVLAEIEQSDIPSFQVRITDNTNSNALYVLEGNLSDSGDQSNIRDLNAASGWTGSSYGNTRAAAPFAILDSVYQAVAVVTEALPNVAMEAVELRWSIDNIAIDGNISEGNIGTSFYDGAAIYILGHADNDTDEYDRSVIQHEFAHFLENTVSRSDNIGGPHSPDSLLDMRVSFGEGFANAFTALASLTGIYEDSGGLRQDDGFRFSLEANTIENTGYFSENTVGLIMYDLIDANDDDGDMVNLGFDAMFTAFSSDTYVNNSAFTSIYLFLDVLKGIVSIDDATNIDALAASQNIVSNDKFGAGETNSGGIAIALPVYKEISVGSSVNACSDNATGSANGLDVSRFIRGTAPTTRSYGISAVRTSGGTGRDPDIVIYQNGSTLNVLDSSLSDIESGSVTIAAGEFILELYDLNNVLSISNSGMVCFNVSIN